MKLKIKETKAVSLAQYPGEEECTQVLLVSGLLTPAIADKLRIKDGCFNEEGIPRRYASYPSPLITVDGADVQLGDTNFHAKMLHKFKITQPKTGGDNDVSLEVSFRIHFAWSEPISAWLGNQKESPFVLGVNARQEDLNFGDEEGDEEETETEEEQQEELPLAGAALASAREAAGGTHQKRRASKEVQ